MRGLTLAIALGAALGCAGAGTSGEPEPSALPTPNAHAPSAPKPPRWPVPAPCEALRFDGPVATSAPDSFARLPRCDVPLGSVRDWMSFHAFTEPGYPNGPADVFHRACDDGTYQQLVHGIAGPYVLQGRLDGDRLHGPVVFAFEGGGRSQLRGAFDAGLPVGDWRWETAEDTVGFAVCPPQHGRFEGGERLGTWTFEELADGRYTYELAFVAGAIEGPVRATVGARARRGVWTGAAVANERDGVWTFTGADDLDGVVVTEVWAAGKLVSRDVEPGTCAVVPSVGPGGKLCE